MANHPATVVALATDMTRWVTVVGAAATPALVAQGIEHRSPKAGVAGSIPAGGTILMARRTHPLDDAVER